MSVRFPVKADKYEDRWGVFDASGYWATFGIGSIEMTKAKATKIAKMLNAAYYQGRSDAKKDVRDALGIEECHHGNPD